MTGSTAGRNGSGAPRRVLQRCLKTAASGADILRARTGGIVVLAYHRVGARSSATEIDLPGEVFAAQMNEIAARVTTLDGALDELDAPTDRAPAPAGVPTGTPGVVVVTFDDGTADFVDDALPVLVELRVPAVLYVATEFVDEARPFPQGGRPLTWSAIRDAVSTGLVTIGSHTHSHLLLDRCTADVATDDLDRSIDLIGEHTGRAPAHFAYPKALAGNAQTAPLLASRFRSAAVAGTRPNRYGATDPMHLARSPIQRSDGMRWFRRKVQGGMAFEDDVRRVANRLRYAGASS